MIEVTGNNLGKYVDFTNEYEDGVSGVITEIKYGYLIAYVNDFDEECEEIVHPRDISYIHE